MSGPTIVFPKRRQERGDTAAVLAAANGGLGEVLLLKEICVEVDTGRIKVGDGVTNYNSMLYWGWGKIDFTALADGYIPAWDAANGRFQMVAQVGGGTSLATEMMADSPTALWKCDETSGTTLADSSGHGNTLTLSGTYTLAYSPCVPSLPGTSFLRIGGATGRASATGAMGLAVPLTGDYTIAAVVTVPFATTTSVRIFAITGNAETAATNQQATLFLGQPTLNIAGFWENGAGTNITVSSDVSVPEGATVMLHLRKNGIANTVDFFINGKLLTTTAYATEPSGGTTVETSIGNDGAATTEVFTAGYVGFYPSALSNARIAAHAVAAGLF